jgi:membrane associated rhomboid family serine protease
MFPYSDENVSLRTPFLTFAIIAANVAAWMLVQGAGSPLPLARSVCNLGLVAGELTGQLRPGTAFPMGEGMSCIVDAGREPIHVLTHMFLHGSWMHLLGNMWFLWIFGTTSKTRWVTSDSSSSTSRAASRRRSSRYSSRPPRAFPWSAHRGRSAVSWARTSCCTRGRGVYVLVLLGFFVTTVAMPAWTMIGYWALIQLFSGVVSLGAQGEAGGGVAFWAHIGGLAAGVVLIRFFARDDYVQEHRAQQWAPKRLGWR